VKILLLTLIIAIQIITIKFGHISLNCQYLGLMSRTNEQLLSESMYYISCKGDDSTSFFDLRDDYINFLTRYQNTLSPLSDTFAYCLTPSQIHLLVRFKNARLAAKTNRAFKTLSVEQMKRQNLENLKRVLPSKAIKYLSIKEVTKVENHKDVIHLIHAKPVSGGFIKTMSRWEFSSYRAYITGKTDTINREEGLNWFGGTEEFLQFHRNHKLSSFQI